MQASTPLEQPRRRRPDVRGRALIITAVATIALGGALSWQSEEFAWARLPDVSFADVLLLRPPPSGSPLEQEVRRYFQQGVVMLHMRQHEHALASFHRVLAIAPDMPEAHANMGFALLGLEEWASARTFFEAAIELNRDQINAYYGLAVALEGLGDLAGALGAMQVYLHRSPEDDPYRSRAMSAVWEWRDVQLRAAAGESPESGIRQPD